MSGVQMKPWLIFSLIFVAGAVAGAALTVGLKSQWQRMPGSKQIQHHWMDFLTQRLALTTVQQAKVGAILSEAGEQMRTVHEDEVDRVSTIFRQTDAKIMPILTADQQAEYAKLQEERQRDIAHHMHHGWGGPPPPHGPPGEGPPPEGAAPGDGNPALR